MNDTMKIMTLLGVWLFVILMLIITVLLIINFAYTYNEQALELNLYDAMGKYIYFINDDGLIKKEILAGIKIKDYWNDYAALFHEVPGDHRKEFSILTVSSREFDFESFGEKWFLTEDKAEKWMRKSHMNGSHENDI